MLIRTERAVAAIQSQANTRAGLFNGGNDLVADVETGNPQAEQLLLHQQQAIADQDASLDLLLASVNRQKQMGMAISDELDQQSSLLDELDDGMETTGMTVNRHQSRIEAFLKQANSGGNFCIILGLSALLMILTMLALDMI
eukprot:TRINITY_DN15397_c0_g1_i4.p1 TRINITY_DN15397_c0_g1~~TRINITY_DN15397_c0_g1_i4.p1  ORF type:complete len:142 (-),score=17.26 TRINITY_DN15397_c0_g1_i4:191-616(-)